jgi:hypothetical protein
MPDRTELAEDAVRPLGIRGLAGWVTHATDILRGCRLWQRSHASPSSPLPLALWNC